METAGGSSPGRRPALARAGQGLGASVQGTQAGLGVWAALLRTQHRGPVGQSEGTALPPAPSDVQTV